MKPTIHIVTFQRPNPPTYGGVIDMYYRIKALHDLGLYVIVHTFAYGDRTSQSCDLDAIADEIHYYERFVGLASHFHYLPYIVYSRRNKHLLTNLLKDNAPILFEGIHCTYYLKHPQLKNRYKIVRMHNIEHYYYRSLAQAKGKITDRIYFFIEALKLKRYEPVLRFADLTASLNEKETDYFKTVCNVKHIKFIPAFFDESPLPVSASGDFILYHGNLNVAENVEAAIWILDNIAANLPGYKFVIAGYNPPTHLQQHARLFKNVKIISSPSNAEMDDLIDKAKIHLLITFQATGVKLKLLNVLYRNGKVIANSLMVSGSKLENHCIIANHPKEICDKITEVFNTDCYPFHMPAAYHSSREKAISLIKDIPYYRAFLTYKGVPLNNLMS